MEFVALSVIIILFLIAKIHFYWVIGWSTSLDKALPKTPDGKRLMKPGKILSALVLFAILSFAFVAYKLGLSNFKDEIYSYMGWAIAAIFSILGIGEFSSIVFLKKITNTLFARYDTLFYSPLCLYLAFCYALLANGYL
ncbi:MAG: DUF3995 domain-containing protein [Sulfurospirillaceae bacterium]|nr:DUF3995 domain-containing protein [Sulfurospirillaceae bacterium]